MATQVDLGRLKLVVPIRLTIPVAIVLVIGVLADQIALGVAAAIGAFICGLADIGDCYPVRARVMVIATVAITLITVIGGAVSSSLLITIALSPLVAFACAYATALGPNAGLTGTLALVMYSLYAGAPGGERLVRGQAAAVLAGCVWEMVFWLGGWPLRRVSGMRNQLADTWRMFHRAATGSPEQLLSPELPAQLVHCAAEIRWSGARGETLRWIQALLDSAELLRLPLASIANRRLNLRESGSNPAELGEFDRLSAAVANLARAVARALVLPVRRKAVPNALAEVEAAAAAARHWAPVQVDALVDACQRAASALSGDLPIGRHGNLSFTINVGASDWQRALGSEMTWSSPILRHAVRMAVLTPVAWIVGELLLTEHKYWVALTVAWIAKPGYGITFGRVVSRTAGTLIGLAVIGIVIFVAAPNVWGLVALCAISAYLMFTAMPVNYALAVVFVTTLIVALLAMSGETLESSLWNRALGTVLGGALALAAAQIGASWAAPTLSQKLAVVAAATQRYVNAVFVRTDDVRMAAGNLVNARRDAATSIQEAQLEPARGRLSPERAQRVLSALLGGIFVVASVDPAVQSDPEFTGGIDPERLDEELEELHRQLVLIDSGERQASTGPIPRVPIVDPEFGGDADPACQAVKRAVAYL